MSLVTQSWLENTTVRRCILVKATVYDYNKAGGAGDITIYMSTTGYITADSAVMFLPIVRKGLRFTESLSTDGNASVSYGDVEIYNPNGEYDDWLDSTKYIWVNKQIQLYYGDPTWISTNEANVYNNFELIFDGIIVDADSKQRDTINFKVRDKIERLNTPLTESKIGVYGTWANGQTNQDTIKPLIFGEVHNTEPVLINPATLEYMFNDGISEALLEIRDNGVPIYTAGILTSGATVNNTTGKFTLNQSLAGQITVSVQGVKNSINLSNGSLISGTYNNNIANLIALITTQYGKSYSRLLAADLDLVQLATFAAANTQSVGIVVNSTENLITICQELASSIGAQLYFTRQGKLQLLKYGVPTTDPSVTITDNDILHHSLYISNRSIISAANKIGYCKNWTVQSNITTSIPEDHRALFGEEWLSYTSVDTNIQSLYKLNIDPEQKDTMLIDGTDAQVEANRLRDYFKVVRTTYSFTGTSKLLSLKLGQPVLLVHNRFGLAQGKTGQVISLSPDWSKGLIDVEVLI